MNRIKQARAIQKSFWIYVLLLALLPAACRSVTPAPTTLPPTLLPTPSPYYQGYTVSGQLIGRLYCNNGASPVPVTIWLEPAGLQFSGSSQFIFENVPDGEYRLVVECPSLGGATLGTMPVTVAGADVVQEIYLPYPTLTQKPPDLVIPAHAEMVTGLAFSPDGSTLISGAQDGTLAIISGAEWENLQVLHTDSLTELNALDISPDGLWLAAGGAEMVELRAVADGALVDRLDIGEETITSLAFSPDGKWLAGLTETAIYRWPVADRADSRRLVLNDTEDQTFYSELTFLDSQTVIVAASSFVSHQHGVQWWDIFSGEMIHSLEAGDLGLYFGINSLAVSPDRRLLAVGPRDFPEWPGSLIFWNLEEDRQTTRIIYPVISDLAFSPDNRLIAAATGGDSLIVWQVADGSPLVYLRAGDAYAYRVAWSPDGRWVAGGFSNGAVMLWLMADGR